MAGEDDDKLTPEELDALDQEEGQDGSEEVDDQEGDGEDEDATGLDADEEEGEEGGQDKTRQEERQTGQVKGRAGGRIARLAKELKEARAEAKRDREDFERRLSQFGQPQGGQQQQVDPRLEAERLAAMTPEERISEQLRQSEARHQQQLLAMQLQNADRQDKDEYLRRAATDARAKRYEPEVEKLLGQFRTGGMNPKREALYFYLLGQKVANAKPAGAKQKQQGQERVRRQETRSSNTGSDTPAKRGGKTLEQRLDGVSI